MLAFEGGKHPAKPAHVEGATTPGKRRAVLAFVGIMFAGESKASVIGPTEVSVPATIEPAPTKN